MRVTTQRIKNMIILRNNLRLSEHSDGQSHRRVPIARTRAISRLTVGGAGGAPLAHQKLFYGRLGDWQLLASCFWSCQRVDGKVV